MNKKHITITVIISILTTVATIALWAGGVSNQQDVNTKDIENLKASLECEVVERKDENTEILVKLAEINTNIIYIKKAIDEKE